MIKPVLLGGGGLHSLTFTSIRTGLNSECKITSVFSDWSSLYPHFAMSLFSISMQFESKAAFQLKIPYFKRIKMRFAEQKAKAAQVKAEKT